MAEPRSFKALTKDRYPVGAHMASYHVTPVDDLLAHEDSEDCPCLPFIEPIETDEGVDYLITHNAWDGRE